MLHDILVKRKSILDQLRKGLSTLGVLAETEYNPSLFEEFFLDQRGLSTDFVLNCLHFQDSCRQNVIDDRVYQMQLRIFLSLSLEYLKFQCLPCHITYQYLAIVVIPFSPQNAYLN